MNFDSSFPSGIPGRPKRRPWSWAAVAGFALASIAALVRLRSSAPYYAVPPANVYHFAGVAGPAQPTALIVRPPTPWQRFASGGTSRLEILLTAPHSSWLGLVHGLKSLGVPFAVTRDYRRAVHHRMIIVYPVLSANSLAPAELHALQRFVSAGGTLVGFNIVDPAAQRLFGVAGAARSGSHNTIRFARGWAPAVEFREPEERSIRFADPSDVRLNMGSYEYRGFRGQPVATYEDGSAAVTSHAIGRGTAYAFGVDAGALMLIGFNNREEHIAGAYVNTFVPTIDVVLRLLRNLYTGAEPDAVTIGSVPFNKVAAVTIAHDVDATISLANCQAYAAYERRAGISTTYFIQTKYVRDFNDRAFFDAKGAAVVSKLQRYGMEVASHSVSHSRDFARFPMGTGHEIYPTYMPFVLNKNSTYNGSVLGELRVSKFLIEHFAKARVVSFRPGYLSNPYLLPSAMESSGYRYSSAVTANDSLTHLPFRLNDGRNVETESSIFEFPVTVEDEASPRMDRREPAAERLANKIGRSGGFFSILIHPNVLGYKLAFEKRFVARFKSKAWFGSLAQFGDWWHARDAVEIDVARLHGRRWLILHAPERIDGLTLILPANVVIGATRPSGAVREQGGRRAVLGSVSGVVELEMLVRTKQLTACCSG